MLKRSIQMSLCGLVAVMALAFTPTKAQAQDWLVLGAKQVVSVLPTSNDTTYNIQNGYWAFNLRDRRTFVFIPAMHLSFNLPYYVGQYQVQGNRVTFSANLNFNVGGSTTGLVQGVLDLNTAQVTMDWQVSRFMSAVQNNLGGIGGPTVPYNSSAAGGKHIVAVLGVAQ